MMKIRVRHQVGSVVQRKRGTKLVWLGRYRDAEGKEKITDPLTAKTRSEAKARMAEILKPINAARAARIDRNITLGSFCKNVFIPLKSGKWKESTADTNSSRLDLHIMRGSLADVPVVQLDRFNLQKFLTSKTDPDQNCSKAVIDHLRFDLGDILKLAESDGLIEKSQSISKVLYTPKNTKRMESKQVMTPAEVLKALDVVALRERTVLRLAIIAGARPGEIVALKWSDIAGDKATISKRFYKGILGPTKNNETRDVYLSLSVQRDLALWRHFARTDSEWVFASEAGSTAIWFENLRTRWVMPHLKMVGLGWVDFQVMRRTNASLMASAGADNKAAADQRGHNIGVSIDDYIQCSLADKAVAVNKLESLLNAQMNMPPVIQPAPQLLAVN